MSRKKGKREVRGAKDPRKPAPGGGRTGVAVWILLLTGALTVAAYANSFGAPFIFDDRASIQENPGIRRLWPPGPALWPPPQMAVSGRPVVSYSFALNYALGGYQVWGYHAFNLIIHLLNALLIFAIIRRTAVADERSPGGNPQSEWLASAATLVWAVHPLLSESVTYITQRTELLASFFLLVTIYAVRRAAETARPNAWAAAAAASSALGMCCKEIMAAAPLLALLYDRCFLASSMKDIFRSRWRLYAGLFSTWLVLAALLATGPRTHSVSMDFSRVTPWNYLLTQAGVILTYLRLSAFPYPLCLDYSDWPIARDPLPVLPAGAAILALLILSAWALRHKPRLGFLGAWFFLILAPSSSLIPIITEPAAERRMYLPLLSVVLLAAIGVHRLALRLLREPRLGRIEAGLVISLAVAFVFITAARNDAYRSEASIWADALAKRPNNSRAMNNLGSVLAREGKSDEALPLFEKALEISPAYPEAHNNLGGALYNQRRMEEAINHFAAAIRLKPDYAEAHLNLGLALHNRGRLDEAIAQYRETLRLRPGEAEAHNHLGAALHSQGKVPEAIEQFREALRLRPDYPEARRGLDRALETR